MGERGEDMTLMLAILCLLFAVFFLIFAGLRLIAPAIIRRKHRIEAPGIDCMETVEIGGIMQTLYFRGKNEDHPVILFLHGGPGNSMFPFLHLFQYDWENDFTIVHWDQRNVGKTYQANDPALVIQTLSAERVLEDVHEVTAYIKQRLNKEKIIVMGHSWGTVLGTMAVQTFPEDYHAYIGISQIINMADNERVGYEKVLELAKAAGNEKDIKALENVTPYPPLLEYNQSYLAAIMRVRAYQDKYGLSVNLSLGNIINILATPYCTFNELRNSSIFKPLDALNAQGDIMRFLLEDADARNFGTDYRIPVYYIMGGNDYISPYSLTKDFFDEITAPDKQIFPIADVGHMPFLENKAEFDRILLKELKERLQE